MAVRDFELGGEVRLGVEHWDRGRLEMPRCDDKVSDRGKWGWSLDTHDVIRPGQWQSSPRREHGREKTMEAKGVPIFDVEKALLENEY